MSEQVADGDPLLTIVIPTRDEAGSIRPLLAQVDASLADIEQAYEVLVVDDSSDDTAKIAMQMRHQLRASVRVLHREPAARTGSLAGAVREALPYARGKWIAVMDADLQHPPRVLASLLAIGESGQYDVVIASRYAPSGDAKGLASPYRRIVSIVATAFARRQLPGRLAHVTDPLSGFFLIRKCRMQIDLLSGLRGFKALFEILMTHTNLEVVEVPYSFDRRIAGRSKASLNIGVHFLVRAVGLRVRPRRSRSRGQRS